MKDAIERYKVTYDGLACNFPDRGKRVMNIIRRIKEEQERRENQRIVNVDLVEACPEKGAQVNRLKGLSDLCTQNHTK